MDDQGEKRERRRLRREASPVGLGELTEDQWRVLQEATDWIAEVVSPPSADSRANAACAEEPSSIFNWVRLDRERHSHVLLIDGGRGSGKTTLLLTMLDQWSRALGRDPICADNSKRDGEEDPKRQLERLTEYKRQLEGLKGRILLVPTLDLQPLPSGTDLLTWIASRLFEGLQLLENRPTEAHTVNRCGSAPWQATFEHESQARKAWHDLVHAQAIGGDGNLEERKRDLDPEAYAVEREEAERRRLTIAECWKRFIDQLLCEARRRFPNELKQNVSLVVSIDDADMNPRFCYPLLELLRVLWHRRVVFLLTGDSALFEAMTARGDRPRPRDFAQRIEQVADAPAYRHLRQADSAGAPAGTPAA
jgi:hypothetical protein